MEENNEILMVTSCGVEARVVTPLGEDFKDYIKLQELVEQDILFSNKEEIKKIYICEKYKESETFYHGERTSEGVSFFHTVDGKEVHVRIC